ncbi:MAG: LamG-like jellyroll fold domain-containing protein [Pseudomonadota bacterium]
MKKYRSQSAFSIIELAIAILIISALVGTIITASRISSNAKLATAQSLTTSSAVNDIDSLVLWFETTMPKSFDNLSADDGQSVSTWYDLSPNRTNAVAGSAPTYTADVINGLPVLRFDGAANFLTFDGSALISSNYTIFAVATRRSTKDNNAILGGTDLTAFKNLHLGYFTNTTPRFKFSHYSEGTSETDYIDSVISTYINPAFEIYTATFDSNIGKTYYKNGAQIASATTSSAKTILQSWTGSAIGRFGTAYFNGDIAEIIIFTKTLSFAERKDVEQYLSKKWGITIS